MVGLGGEDACLPLITSKKDDGSQFHMGSAETTTAEDVRAKPRHPSFNCNGGCHGMLEGGRKCLRKGPVDLDV